VQAKQVTADVKDARLQALQTLICRQQDRFNAGCGGKTFPVLFDKPGRKKDQAVGRSPFLQPVHVEGAAPLIGSLHDVTVTEVLPNSLRGVLANASEEVLAL
jgi:tRNA-2-methylthio-N6-dimethylallyladenosine synthase